MYHCAAIVLGVIQELCGKKVVRVGNSRKSTLGQFTKGRLYAKCPQLSTRGSRGHNSIKFGPHSC